MDGLKVPGLDDDQLVTLNLLVEQLAAKRPRNLKRTSFYDGKNAQQQISGIIPPTYSNIGLALGWAAKGVDGLARRCTLEKFVWSDGDVDSLGLDVLEDSNFLRSELSQARTDSLLHGVSYLVTTKGDAGEPAALVHARDGLNGTGEWSVRKRALTSFLSVTGRDGNDITDFVLYLDGLTITASRADGKWKKADESKHPWGVPVDPLVYRPRSSRRMGKSRITRPVMSHQSAALRALVRLEAHMDVYTIPKLIMLGADESIFKNADGSPKASWQVALARTFGIPDSDDPLAQNNGRVDVKHIPAESPEPHLKDLNALAKLMARETDLPDSDFALTDMVNPTSEGSYVAGRENLIAEAEGAMDDWSVGMRRTVRRALAIQNGLSEVPEEWRSLAPKWRNPLFTSRAAAADAGAKQIASVPWLAETEVGLELLGLDPQQIERAQAERRRNAGRAVLTAVAEQAIAS